MWIIAFELQNKRSEYSGTRDCSTILWPKQSSRATIILFDFRLNNIVWGFKGRFLFWCFLIIRQHVLDLKVSNLVHGNFPPIPFTW